MMNALPGQRQHQDGVCPACSAPLTQCAGRRKKKVQCPKCRQIVILEPKESVEPVDPGFESVVMRELAEIKVRLARLAPLQNRMAEIERELAQLKSPVVSEPPPAPAPLPARFLQAAALAPHAPLPERLPVAPTRHSGELSIAEKRYGIGEQTAIQFGEFLEPSRGSRISIVFGEGDAAAKKVGEYLRDRFFYAGWTVLDLRAEAFPAPAHGLALAAGLGPMSSAVAAVHRAFAAANIALAFQIDPAISDPSVTLIVGAAPGAR